MTYQELKNIEAIEAEKKEDAFDAIIAANKARKQYAAAQEKAKETA
jgi:hypothetical protein